MKSSEYNNMAVQGDHHWYFQGMGRILLTLIRAAYGRAPNLQILDAGSGTCWFTAELSEFGEVIALDISEDALAVCRSRGIKNVVKADVAAMPFDDATFDLVVCSEVLYHQLVPDDAAVMREFARVLKPGGRAVVKVPAHAYLGGAHDRINMTRKRFEEHEVAQLFTDNGFSAERISFANFFLFPIVYLKRKFERAGEASDIHDTNALINALLLGVLTLEARIIAFSDLPQGSSIVAIGRKEGGEETEQSRTNAHRYRAPVQVIKYIISGGSAATFELLLLYLFTQYAGIWYVYSVVLAFLFAFFISFSLQKTWTFRDLRWQGVHRKATLYLVVSVINLCVNVGAIYVLVQVFHLWYLFAQVLIDGVIAVSSFLVYKFLIFDEHTS